MKKKVTIEELLKRVEALEAKQSQPCPLPHYYHNFQYTPPLTQVVSVHYHNGNPCYNNPCTWC